MWKTIYKTLCMCAFKYWVAVEVNSISDSRALTLNRQNTSSPKYNDDICLWCSNSSPSLLSYDAGFTKPACPRSQPAIITAADFSALYQCCMASSLTLNLTSCKFYLIRISWVLYMTLTPLLTLTQVRSGRQFHHSLKIEYLDVFYCRSGNRQHTKFLRTDSESLCPDGSGYIFNFCLAPS